MNIGVFCPDLSDSYQRPLVAALHRRAVLLGHAVTVVNTSIPGEAAGVDRQENRVLTLMSHPLWDGLVVFTDSIGHKSPAERIRDRLVPLRRKDWVSIGRLDWHQPAVTVDNSGLTKLLAHLHDDHHHRRFLFLSGPDTSIDGRERTLLFREYMEGRPWVRWEILPCDFMEEKALSNVLGYFQSPPPFRPEAIVAANDGMARGALRALRLLGLRCPEDCVVTGFDDWEEAEFESPALTTVRQSLDDVAEEALLALIRLKSGAEARSAAVPTRLVVRESCGCQGSLEDPQALRLALSRVYALKSRETALWGAEADFGASVNAVSTQDGLLHRLSHHCRTLGIPRLSLNLTAPEDVPERGLPTTWSQIFVQEDQEGRRPGAPVGWPELLASAETDEDLVPCLSLLYTDEEVLGLLACTVPIRWAGFLRLLVTNLANGVSRVKRMTGLVQRSADLELSAAERAQQLTEVVRALNQENDRRSGLERSLEAERKAFQQIFEAQPVALVLFSRSDGRILSFNRQFAALIGLPAPPEFPAEGLTESYRSLFQLPPGEGKLETSDGRVVPILTARSEIRLREENVTVVGLVDLSQQKQLEQDLLTIREITSQRFGQELHDDVCQKLGALALFSNTLDRQVEEQLGRRLPAVAELTRLTEEILNHVRGLSHGLFPMDVGTMPWSGLVSELIGQMAHQSDLKLTWGTNLGDGMTGLTAAEELHAYRIVQELLHNTVRHGRATLAHVELERQTAALVLHYRDNGVGLAADHREGLGMRSIRYRASQLGAQPSWSTPEGGGSAFHLTIPLPRGEGTFL